MFRQVLCVGFTQFFLRSSKENDTVAAIILHKSSLTIFSDDMSRFKQSVFVECKLVTKLIDKCFSL